MTDKETSPEASALAAHIDHWAEWESECNPNGEAFDLSEDGASYRLAEYLVKIGYGLRT